MAAGGVQTPFPLPPPSGPVVGDNGSFLGAGDGGGRHCQGRAVPLLAGGVYLGAGGGGVAAQFLEARYGEEGGRGAGQPLQAAAIQQGWVGPKGLLYAA